MESGGYREDGRELIYRREDEHFDTSSNPISVSGLGPRIHPRRKGWCSTSPLSDNRVLGGIACEYETCAGPWNTYFLSLDSPSVMTRPCHEVF